jgi:hypothetical protein
MPDAYLADDADARLRHKAAKTCRDCVHLVTRSSGVVGNEQVRCGSLDDESVSPRLGAVVTYLLMERAQSGICPMHEPLFGGA